MNIWAKIYLGLHILNLFFLLLVVYRRRSEYTELKKAFAKKDVFNDLMQAEIIYRRSLKIFLGAFFIETINTTLLLLAGFFDR